MFANRAIPVDHRVGTVIRRVPAPTRSRESPPRSLPPHRPSNEDAVPTYQYACTECGHEFEQVQSFSDDALTVCPVCGGRLRKVYGAVGVVFKGSGFYRTDSRNGKKPG